MSCRLRDIEVRQTSQQSGLSPRYVTLSGAITVPVFCACMIAAMGSPAGFRQVITMLFDIDANTEYILRMDARTLYPQQDTIEERS
ncbi:MAG TPA: hypothetical protein ENJ87_09940 [Gammaproteobacteria bacterium]|nr:hypothetical protein [Gammaproteobacteria bacterium]